MRHIPRRRVCTRSSNGDARVKEEGGKSPYAIKEDAVEQALLAYKTSFPESGKKQRERGEAVEPFNVHFRKYGQMSVINLPKSNVLMDFLFTCEKEGEEGEEKKEEEKRQRRKKKKKKKRTRTENQREHQSPFLCEV